MKLKTKIWLGYMVVLVLLLAIGGYSLFNLNKLDKAAQNILKANLYSVQLGTEMTTALDHILVSQQKRYFSNPEAGSIQEEVQPHLQKFEHSLQQEQNNITEPGEKELVAALTTTFAGFQGQVLQRNADLTAANYFTGILPRYQELRQQIDQIIKLNTAALKAKNQTAQLTAGRVIKYSSVMLVVSWIITLIFALTVPKALTKPIHKLINSLENVTDRNFTRPLPEDSRDEFGTVAIVFNKMLARLQEYEQSSLAELITEKNRIDSVITNLDEAIILIDAASKIILANPVACRLLGLPKEQLINQPASELSTRNDLFRELLKDLDKRPLNGTDQLVAITDNGEESFYRREVFPVKASNKRNQTQEPGGYIIALYNVSEFKKMDQVKSNFLATVSHELKTPLASINYSLKLLQDNRVGAMNAEQQEIVHTIKQENQRLQKMVSELLDVSKIESGNIQLNTERASIAAIVRFAAEPIQLQLKERNIQLKVNLPAGLPAVNADVEKTAWVLLNLISNAIRYSAVNEIIEISARTENAEVLISVKDNGPGIEIQNQEKIFQKFVQLPGKAEYKGGAGLGLSISREFIQSQGGRIWVESEIGKGSIFSFALPIF